MDFFWHIVCYIYAYIKFLQGGLASIPGGGEEKGPPISATRAKTIKDELCLNNAFGSGAGQEEAAPFFMRGFIYAVFPLPPGLSLECSRMITSLVLHNLPPEIVIVSGSKSILIICPVFGEYYTFKGNKKFSI